METTKFIKKVTQPEIAISGKLELDLNELRSDFGDNFNTLFLTNTSSTSDISIFLDSEEIAFVTQGNGSFSFDGEFGMIFNSLAIENKSAAVAVAANDLKIFAGRTRV